MRVGMQEGIEIKFAQKLAGNEKEGRDKALKKLKKWIKLKSNPDSSESAYTELELLKLWKGLFYCMWMSDKPLVQEELAEELSRLVHLFPHGLDAVTFCSSFFTTMAREWHSIDVIRREKFMMLVRRVLRQSLALAAAAGWAGAVTDRLRDLYVAAFARPEDPARLPLGLQLHLVEIFLEEVAKVGGAGLSQPQLATLLAPFVQIIKVSKQSTLRSTVTDSIFFHLMRQSDVGMAHEAQLNGEDLDASDDSEEEDDEEVGHKALDPRAGGVDVTLPQLDVDYARLADELVAAGAEPAVRQVNRAALYRLGQQFRDLSEGVYPLALRIPENVDSDSDISDEDMQAAVLRLQATKEHLNKDSRKNQKRLMADADEEPQPKKKKIRYKMLANGVIDTGEEMMAECNGAQPEEAEEAGEPEKPTSHRRTLKEKRRHKLKEKKEAEMAKQDKKKKKLDAKMAKLNGDASDLEKSHSMQNGTVLNGDHKKVGKKASKAEALDKTVEETHEEVQHSLTPSPVTSKPKKKRLPKDDSVQTDNDVSLDESTPRKKKASKKSADKEPTVPSASTVVNCSAADDDAPSTPRPKKSKKKQSAVVPSETAPQAGDGPAAARSAFDWTLAAADDWDEPSAAHHQVAHFVPSKPVPTFVKLRSGKKARKTSPKSPATPLTPGGTKKVKINLAENKSQGFKEHLITVRNSPQVPHNPDRRPVKGLLKAPVTPTSAAAAGPQRTKTPTGRRRRSHAADFFGL